MRQGYLEQKVVQQQGYKLKISWIYAIKAVKHIMAKLFRIENISTIIVPEFMLSTVDSSKVQDKVV